MRFTDQDISAQIQRDKAEFSQRSSDTQAFLRREAETVRASYQREELPRRVAV